MSPGDRPVHQQLMQQSHQRQHQVLDEDAQGLYTSSIAWTSNADDSTPKLGHRLPRRDSAGPACSSPTSPGRRSENGAAYRTGFLQPHA